MKPRFAVHQGVFVLTLISVASLGVNGNENHYNRLTSLMHDMYGTIHNSVSSRAESTIHSAEKLYQEAGCAAQATIHSARSVLTERGPAIASTAEETMADTMAKLQEVKSVASEQLHRAKKDTSKASKKVYKAFDRAYRSGASILMDTADDIIESLEVEKFKSTMAETYDEWAKTIERSVKGRARDDSEAMVKGCSFRSAKDLQREFRKRAEETLSHDDCAAFIISLGNILRDFAHEKIDTEVPACEGMPALLDEFNGEYRLRNIELCVEQRSRDKYDAKHNDL